MKLFEEQEGLDRLVATGHSKQISSPHTLFTTSHRRKTHGVGVESVHTRLVRIRQSLVEGHGDSRSKSPLLCAFDGREVDVT
jgi:hypothetical protein